MPQATNDDVDNNLHWNQSMHDNVKKQSSDDVIREEMKHICNNNNNNK